MTFKTATGEYETAEAAITEVIADRVLDILLADSEIVNRTGRITLSNTVDAIARNRAIIARALTRDVDFID